jgi:hypothetical protein
MIQNGGIDLSISEKSNPKEQIDVIGKPKKRLKSSIDLRLFIF